MNKAHELAREDLGTWEWDEGHNPKVVQYFHDVGHEWVMDDETAWCAAFVGAMLKRAGMAHTGKLNARSYEQWGEEVPLREAQPGDIVVFSRGDPKGWQGHVGFYESHDEVNVRVLGGNQANQVNIKPYARARLLSVRRAPETINPSAVALPKERKSSAKSKTVQASVATAAGGVGTAVSALSGLDQYAQYIVLGFAGLVVLGALFIMRERLKAWAEGWR
jgi:uncharacterized protein (TIGR02594 family)